LCFGNMTAPLLQCGIMAPTIVTARLELIASTAAHLSAEISNRVEFGRLLNAEVPANWPPKSITDAIPTFLKWLEAEPDHVGWYNWYSLANNTLIGSGGFMGPPKGGMAKVGYSVLPQYQRRGFATEMVAALVDWAFANPEVRTICAETEWENRASVRVLT